MINWRWIDKFLLGTRFKKLEPLIVDLDQSRDGWDPNFPSADKAKILELCDILDGLNIKHPPKKNWKFLEKKKPKRVKFYLWVNKYIIPKKITGKRSDKFVEKLRSSGNDKLFVSIEKPQERVLDIYYHYSLAYTVLQIGKLHDSPCMNGKENLSIKFIEA